VEDIGQLTLSQETVVPEFLGHVENPTVDDIPPDAMLHATAICAPHSAGNFGDGTIVYRKGGVVNELIEPNCRCGGQPDGTLLRRHSSDNGQASFFKEQAHESGTRIHRRDLRHWTSHATNRLPKKPRR
jgi:hypothetical protein